MLKTLRKTLFGMPHKKMSFAHLGIAVNDPEVGQHLERTLGYFLAGYHLSLEHLRVHTLKTHLEGLPLGYRSFAYEGAAMGVMLMDLLLPRKNRIHAFIEAAGPGHVFMAHVGAGLAITSLRYRPQRFLPKFHPILRFLAIDGFGFHRGFFKPKKFLEQQGKTKRLGRNAFLQKINDQGLGRAIWFRCCGDPSRISQTVNAFESHRQAPIWNGVGAAAAFAGGPPPQVLKQLLAQVPENLLPHVAQGTAFAALVRTETANPMAHTAQLVDLLWGLPLETVGTATQAMMPSAKSGEGEKAYEAWGEAIRHHFRQAGKQPWRRKNSLDQPMEAFA